MSPDSKWLCTFKANEIQKFIFSTNKLKEMIGASEMINRLSGEFLDDFLTTMAITIQPKHFITRAAGWGRFICESREDAERFMRYWPLAVSQLCPGLKMSQSLAQIDDGNFMEARKNSESKLQAAKNQHWQSEPEAPPMATRSRLSGDAATKYYHSDKEYLDASSSRKRDYAKERNLLSLLTEEDSPDIEKWPKKFTEISGDERSYLAIIHADGNGFGQHIKHILDNAGKSAVDPADVMRDFSNIVKETATHAAREAYKQVLEKDYNRRTNKDKQCEAVKYAARPIIIGGDDLTVVTRADLGIEFTKIYLEEFEKKSAELLEERTKSYNIESSSPLPKVLTACAGVAIVKQGYPFYLSSNLAETLCKYAKTQSRKPSMIAPSSFAFYRHLNHSGDDYKEICEKEFKGKDGLKLFFGPYCVGNFRGSYLPQFAQLEKLRNELKDMPRKPLREMAFDAYDGVTPLIRSYNRFLENIKDAKGEDKKYSVNNAFKKLTESRVDSNPDDSAIISGDKHTPLFEALWLLGLTPDKEDENA